MNYKKAVEKHSGLLKKQHCFRHVAVLLLAVIFAGLVSGCGSRNESSYASDNVSSNAASSETEQVTTEKTTVEITEATEKTINQDRIASLSGWKRAFADYINGKSDKSSEHYSLIQIDDDDIPELYCYDDNLGYLIVYYNGNSVNYVELHSHIRNYAPRQCMLILEKSDMSELSTDYYFSRYYNGVLTELETARELFAVGTHYWNKETVTRSEYYEKMQAYEETINTSVDQCSGYDVFEHIVNY